MVQRLASSWWWFNDNLTSNSFEVKWWLRFTDTSVVDTVSVSRAESSIVVARWNWWWRNFAVISFILRTFGVRSARTLDQGFIGVSSNSRVRTPRALDTN